jgi:hypothetical protein
MGKSSSSWAGRAIAVENARHGADVPINYRVDNDAQYHAREASAEVMKEIERLGASEPTSASRRVISVLSTLPLTLSNAEFACRRKYSSGTMAGNFRGAFYLV